MKKLSNNVARIKDQLNKLDTPFSVWLLSFPSIFNPKRFVFSKRLRELTGYDDSKDMKKLLKLLNCGVYTQKTDEWALEIKKNGRARIKFCLSYADAEKLRSQIAGIGGKVIVQQDDNDSVLMSKRLALEEDLRNAEAAVKAEQQRVDRALYEAKQMPDYSGMLKKEVLELIKNFAEEHEVEYFITKDGLVDIFGDVEIYSDDLNENYYLPFAFGRVYGDFDCNDSGISSLDRGPIHVDGDFDCSYNYLESFYGCPRYVGGDFFCVGNEDYGDFDYKEEELPDYIGGECTIEV